MNKIIIIEDNLYTAENLEIYISIYFEELYSQNLEIYVCNDIYEANEELKKHSDISCIISDLNMNPDGMDEKFHEETYGTVLTGWVWVKYYILNNRIYSQIPIIFYSAFINELKTYTDYNEYYKKHKIELINKGNESEKILCEKIKEMISEETT